jgi:hypothetical protein
METTPCALTVTESCNLAACARINTGGNRGIKFKRCGLSTPASKTLKFFSNACVRRAIEGIDMRRTIKLFTGGLLLLGFFSSLAALEPALPLHCGTLAQARVVFTARTGARFSSTFQPGGADLSW